MTTSPESIASDTGEQIRQLRAQLDALMADRIQPAIAAAAETATKGVQRAGKLAEEEIEVVSTHVRNRPLTSILAAAAVGYLIARLTR